ncbi:MAG: oxidation resistance protein 1 [Piccolia ochrophora]|nr:MAG: oxidation resistance protein 1 [Piccolia ochrophora]
MSSSSSRHQSPSSSSYLPSALTNSATQFLKRFYTDPAMNTGPTTSSSPAYSGSTPTSTPGTYTPPAPPRGRSPFQPPPLYPLCLSASGPSQLLTRALAEEIRLLIPARLQLVEEWTLVYGLERDGVSLATLYKKCEAMRDGSARRGFVLVVRDGDGSIFGAYLTDAPHPAPHYYGTGECFLWRASLLPSSPSLLSLLPPPPSSDTTHMTRSTTIASPTDGSGPSLSPRKSRGSGGSGGDSTTLSPGGPTSVSSLGGGGANGASTPRIRFKAFPYSGVNDYMIFCETGFLSVGGGDGHYGLWLDDVFERGVSSACPTFGNEPLSDEGDKFDVLGVEVWAVG